MRLFETGGHLFKAFCAVRLPMLFSPVENSGSQLGFSKCLITRRYRLFFAIPRKEGSRRQISGI
ncbi:MAG: hypothetical protein ACPGNR_00005, partial [Paracoccaceae bacterium]